MITRAGRSPPPPLCDGPHAINWAAVAAGTGNRLRAVWGGPLVLLVMQKAGSAEKQWMIVLQRLATGGNSAVLVHRTSRLMTRTPAFQLNSCIGFIACCLFCRIVGHVFEASLLQRMQLGLSDRVARMRAIQHTNLLELLK
jgi:hypothetical protein